MAEAQVMYDSDEAAEVRWNISGWVDRNGRFWGNDEHMARWSGCTHIKCECGAVREKCWTKCEACREHGRLEHYIAMPVQDWDHDSPIYSLTYERYFFNDEQLQEFVGELFEDGADVTELSMMLITCVPQHYHQIDAEIYHDIMAEDEEDLPMEIQQAMDVFNRAVSAYVKPASWAPCTHYHGAKPVAICVPWLAEYVEENLKKGEADD